MKLHSQISLISILILTTTVGIILGVAILEIELKGESDIKVARTRYVDQVKNKLRKIVQIAEGVIQTNYEATTDPKQLKQSYGSRLRASVLKCMFTHAMPSSISSTAPTLKEFNKNHAITDNISKSHNVTVFIFEPKNVYAKDQLFTLLKHQLMSRKHGFIYAPNSRLHRLAYFCQPQKFSQVILAGISPEQVEFDAKEKTKNTIRKLLYGGKGRGYIFVNNMKAFSVIHPFLPLIEGSDYSVIPDAAGKLHVPEMVDICRKYGEGFLTYFWPKHEYSKPEQPPAPKLTFVKLFKPWGWIVGTGEYIDEIDKMAAKSQEIIRSEIDFLVLKVLTVTLVIMLLMIIACIFFAKSISNPISKLIATMKSLKTEKLAAGLVTLNGCTEIKELGSIFNNMLESINSGIKKVKKNTITKKRLESELDIAENIRGNHLLCPEPVLSKTSNFEVSALVQSGTPPGGDMHDYFMIDENHFCLAIGDVSGKGVSATLFMAVTRTLLRTKAAGTVSPGEIATEVNRCLCLGNEMSMFVKLILIVLNTKNGILSYTNAGYLPFFRLNNKHRVPESIPVIHGLPLGVSSSENYEEDKIKLAANDKLVFCSDGVINAHNYTGEKFGRTRLLQIIESSNKFDAKKTNQYLMTTVTDFIGTTEIEDDLLVLTLRYCKQSKS